MKYTTKFPTIIFVPNSTGSDKKSDLSLYAFEFTAPVKSGTELMIMSMARRIGINFRKSIPTSQQIPVLTPLNTVIMAQHDVIHVLRLFELMIYTNSHSSRTVECVLDNISTEHAINCPR
jgi:hypothetical protein